jgi:hypothetical protein
MTQKVDSLVLFVSYGAGSTFLKFLGAPCVNLPQPAGAVFTHRTFPGWDLFELQDYLGPIMDDFQPDLVVCDGELYVPIYCKMRGTPCISVASPNYISLDFGPYEQYADLIAQLLNISTVVLGYGASDCQPSMLLDASRLVMISPPMKYDRSQLSARSVREKYGFKEEDQIVLVYRGAGNISTPEFLSESKKIIDIPVDLYLEHLQHLYPRMKLVLVSGAPVAIPVHKNIRFESYVDFMELASASSLVIARAGRNVMYEMAYLGVPSILIGIDSKTDLYRNCEIAEQWQIAWTLHATEMNPATLLAMIERAMLPGEAQRISKNGRAFVPENGILGAVDKIVEILETQGLTSKEAGGNHAKRKVALV